MSIEQADPSGIVIKATVHTVPPQGVFTLFLRENPETAMREIAVFANALLAMRFSAHKLRERSEQ